MKIKRRLTQAAHVLFLIAVHAGLFWPVLNAVGCAGQATSDITPARSDAASLFVSAPTRSYTEITVTTPAPGVGFEVVEEGEDK